VAFVLTSHPLRRFAVLALSCLFCACSNLVGGGQRQGAGLQCSGTRAGASASPTLNPDAGRTASCTRVTELRLSCEEHFVTAGAIDIVWVIDNSGSMADEVDDIRTNVNRFAERISGTGLDHHIVFVTAAAGDPKGNGLCIPEPLAGPGCADSARLRHVNEWVDSHDAPERLMSSYWRFSDFLRTESNRIVVYVSDDNADLSASQVLAELPARAPLLAGAGTHAIVGPSDEDCPDIAAAGTAYMELAARTGGLVVPICCSDYTQLTDTVADEITSSSSRLLLSEDALPDTLQVFLQDSQGALIQATTGWSYDSTARAVTFEAAHRPGPGVPVVIRYTARG
jgi:hypothetical protein